MTAMLAITLMLATVNSEEFLRAVGARDVEAVKSMLEQNPDLANARRPDGASAVIVALFALKKGEERFPDPATNATLQAILARQPKLDLFETAALGTSQQLEALLHADPAAISRQTRFGWTLLHLAAYAGNAANTQLLVDRGANVNVRAQSKFRNTPLQTALLTGQYATAKILLDHGADPLVRQAAGFAPMHEAASLGRADLVQLLLDHGAELNSRSDSGRTPLGDALRAHHEELAAMLKAKGASVEPVPDAD